MRARDHRITQLEKHIATIRPAVEQLQTSGRTNSVKRIVAKMIHKKKCLSFFWWLNKLHTVQREERIVCKFVTRMKQRLEWQAFHAMVQHARVRVRHRAVVLHGRRSFFFSLSPLLRLLFSSVFSFVVFFLLLSELTHGCHFLLFCVSSFVSTGKNSSSCHVLLLSFLASNCLPS